MSEIPIDVLQFDLKKKIFLSFQFSKGKFSSKLNLVNLLKDLIYFISFYFWIMIFSKKLEVKKKVDIIFDDLDNFDHLIFSVNYQKNLLIIFIIKKKNEKKNHYHFRPLSFVTQVN